MIIGQIQQQFAKNGYLKLDGFFETSALYLVKQVVAQFHQAWCIANNDFYISRAINSSGLTSGLYLTEQQRLTLFKLISDCHLLEVVHHKNWDTEEESQVRLELNGHKNSENLSNGVQIPLQVGDVLLFSANMIHRGLYGKDRLALDILYCERVPQLVEFIQVKHQPSAEMLADLDKSLFL